MGKPVSVKERLSTVLRGPRADLIFSAALGLAGVALRAGARSALATLWSVNDQASADLVSEFYAQLAEPALSRAQALQRAQVEMLHMHHYRHPSYWSAFVLISSWL